jgi:hypothetical protein
MSSLGIVVTPQVTGCSIKSNINSFLGPMRWLHAGGGLSRLDQVDQCFEDPLMRPERPPKANSRLPNSPACRHADRLMLASRPAIEPGADAKSP